MANLGSVVQQLRKERDRVAKDVERMNAALAALSTLSINGSKRSSHGLSASARRKISLAQKARWAKQSATPRRTMSAAGRKRIAAAQRARWAKVKAQRKKTA